MSTESYREVKLIVVVSLITGMSIASHIICFDFISAGGLILIPSSPTYMLVLALLDFLAVSFNRKIVFCTILMESVINAILLLIVRLCLLFQDSSKYTLSHYMNELISGYSNMYVANLTGSLTAFLINFFIFNFFYRRKGFFASSVISSVILLLIYTPITDYLAFSKLSFSSLTGVIVTNIITNIITFIFWSALITIWLRKDKEYA